MAYEATPARVSAIAAVRASEAFRAALRVGLSTRLAVLLVAIFAALSFGPAGGGLARENALKFDEPGLTHAIGDPVLAPLARWDSVWYLRIADSGYRADSARAAFFPLYPLLVRGRRLARPTLLLLALFPAAVYFGAPYSESLFLLLAVGVFYAGRTGNWAWAGACAGLASATRSAGLLLAIPLALIWWSSRPRRPRDAAWLLLAPLGIGAYAAWLGLMEGDALRFLDVQEAWSREVALPLAGAWDGLVAAVDGARQLASGSRAPVYFEAAAGDPFRIAAINVMLFATLVFAVGACVGALRRLPRPYGIWVAASLVLPLSFPVTPQPLMSLPRFVSVLFPVFMWLALVCEERRVTDLAVAASALGLGLFTAQYASWHWIA